MGKKDFMAVCRLQSESGRTSTLAFTEQRNQTGAEPASFPRGSSAITLIISER
jgi:hypothetical protein